MVHSMNSLHSVIRVPGKSAAGVLGTITLLALAVLLQWQAAGASGVELDHVDGLIGPGQIPAGVPITFHFKFGNNSGSKVVESLNGIRLSSPDGADWQPPVGTWVTGVVPGMYSGASVYYFSANGISPDTIGFEGFGTFGNGIPDGYDSVVFTLTTTFSPSSVGKTLHVDSCWFPPINDWHWINNVGNFPPDWSGPHTFSIVAQPACAGNGDVNCDDKRTSADIINMVNYVFKSGPAPCSCP